MSDKTIKLTIDGIEIEARSGQTIMQAADDAGIYIPRLCAFPELPPHGSCRVCTVKVGGAVVRVLHAACLARHGHRK